MKDTLDRNMSGVHFVNTPDLLIEACAEEMVTISRVVVHVDATTMDKETLGTTLDLIQKIWVLYHAGAGAHPGQQTKFRIVILTGQRWDLLEKIGVKAKALFPTWARPLKTPIEFGEWQSHSSGPP